MEAVEASPLPEQDAGHELQVLDAVEVPHHGTLQPVTASRLEGDIKVT